MRRWHGRILNGRGEHREVLQRALHCLVEGAVLVAAVTVGSAQRLQLAEVAVKVVLAQLLHRRRSAPREAHVLQQRDHIVPQALIVLV